MRWVCWCSVQLWPLPGRETCHWGGDGTVRVELAADRVVFRCEDEGKADILIGKLLADLFWDAGSAHLKQVVSVGGRGVPVHVWPPYGAMAAARVGESVIVMGGKGPEVLGAKVAGEPLLLQATARFGPEAAYPL